MRAVVALSVTAKSHIVQKIGQLCKLCFFAGAQALHGNGQHGRAAFARPAGKMTALSRG